MAGTRRTGPRPDVDGVRIEKLSGVRGGVWLMIAALVAVGIALLVLSRPRVAPPGERSADARPAAAPGGGGTSRSAAPAPGSVEPRRAAVVPPAPADKPAAPQENPPAPAEAAAGMFDGAATTGEPSGIALFPPPGTDPVKRGLVVPDGFELPPGYVRHYQTTDDGESLPPILMFHPDYEFVDESGTPVALPEDRVVPAELAPSGLPIRMLDVPKAPARPAPAP